MASNYTSFLSLPLEIRFMVYDLVMLSQPARGEIRSYRYQGGKHVHRSRYRRPGKNEHMLDSYHGLFIANRQIYFEMEHLLHKNPVNLTITDNLFFTSCADTASLDQLVEKHSWIRENTKEVRLQFVSSPRTMDSERGLRTTEDHKSLEQIVDFDSVKAQVMVENFWRAFFCLVYCWTKIQPQLPNSLEKMTKFLKMFPRLESVELIWDYPGKGNTWVDFWGDIKALASTGIKCSLVVFEDDNIVDLFRFLQQQGGMLLMTSSWQYGEHTFCEAHVESRTWRRSGLDTGMRWENRFRILAPDGDLSVPILMGDLDVYSD